MSLSIGRGASLGVIGESGCGKSTLARVIAGLAPQTRGTVSLAGQSLAPTLDSRSRDQLRRIQLVFQSADTALNPTMSVEEIIGRPLTFYFGLRGEARRAEVRRMLELTRLPADAIGRRPGDLSGGQKQRVNLARALAAKPDLLLCDEVTSALDTVVAAAILDLLVELRRDLGLTMMFISHDLKTVRAICDDVMVLYAGRAVETMAAAAVADRDHHPYTRMLLASVPHLRRGWLEEGSTAVREGRVDLTLKDGCVFRPRCSSAIPGSCDVGQPPVRTSRTGGTIACHLPALAEA